MADLPHRFSLTARIRLCRPGRNAAGGRDAGGSARRRDHADLPLLHPQQRPDAGASARSGWLELRRRRRGRARRSVSRVADLKAQFPAQDVPHGARMRRQRALVLRAAGRRQSLDQWRRRLRRMDRRFARRRAARRRAEADAPCHTAHFGADPDKNRATSKAVDLPRRAARQGARSRTRCWSSA